jgi:cytochrome oxidase assembly protein ShyY1
MVQGGMFSPENKLADEQWYWFEVDKMRQALGLDYTPALLDFVAASTTPGTHLFPSLCSLSCVVSVPLTCVDHDDIVASPAAKDSYPVPQPIVTKLRDNHLNYIITWYDHARTHARTHLIRAF